MNDKHPPRLAAAGAGLPPLERLVSRAALTVFAATVSREAVLKRFRTEVQRAIDLVQPLSTEVATRRVLIPRPLGLEDSSRYWSPCMTLEHLVIVNLGIAGIIRGLCAADDSKPQGQSLTEVRIEDVKPSEDAGPEQIDRLRKAAEVYTKTVSHPLSLKTTARHPHPWFGPMDAAHWHALAAVHCGLHRRQIVSILRSG